MNLSLVIGLVVFGGTSLLIVLLSLRSHREKTRTQARLRGLGAETPPAKDWHGLGQRLVSGLPLLGTALLPKQEAERSQLRNRLIQAGFYNPQTVLVFVGAKMLLFSLGIAVGLLGAFLVGLSVPRAMLVGLLACGVGLVAPGFWLSWKIARRQTILRRSLPDALDMLVLCLEGGLSLNAAIQRITGELQSVHPLLAAEMSIVLREMLLGLSAGDGLRKLGQRADLEEVRSLAAVLQQSERYGASVVKALRIYSDTLRQQRHQRVEERAQKAAVKILFPTLLCIFPAIFVVILGPAVYQIKAIFARMK